MNFRVMVLLTAAALVLVPLSALPFSPSGEEPFGAVGADSVPAGGLPSAPPQTGSIYRGAPQSFRILDASTGQVRENNAVIAAHVAYILSCGEWPDDFSALDP